MTSQASPSIAGLPAGRFCVPDTGHALPESGDTGSDFWMYLQLRATPGTVNTCLTRLDRHIRSHPGAAVEIVGIGSDPRTVRIIIGVNLGDSFKIKARPENVLAAYEFVRSLSTNLANFWPQYLSGTPTDEERDLLASVIAAGSAESTESAGSAESAGSTGSAGSAGSVPARPAVGAHTAWTVPQAEPAHSC